MPARAEGMEISNARDTNKLLLYDKLVSNSMPVDFMAKPHQVNSYESLPSDSSYDS